jgi:hypothetical protein
MYFKCGAWLVYQTTKQDKHGENDAVTYSRKWNCLDIIFKLIYVDLTYVVR